MTKNKKTDSPNELGELAQLLGAELIGDASLVIEAVRSLETAGPNDLSFLTSTRYRAQAEASRAGALLIDPEAEHDGLPKSLLVCEDPYLALARLLQHLHPSTAPEPGVHPTAVVAETAVVDPTATIGPYVVVGEETVISPRAVLWSHVAVGRRCFIGANAQVHPHVAIYDQTVIEEGGVLHAGSVLGADGFGYAESAGSRVKLPQVGRVVLEQDVEVGANSAIDRATLDETRIGRGTKIDNLVQIGHNVVTGKGCILCGQTGISGSAILGDGVVMAGQTGAAGHLRIGDGAMVAAKSAVFQEVPDGQVVAGIPAQPISGWKRQVATVRRVADLRARVRKLEKRLLGEGDSLSSQTSPSGEERDG